MICVSLLAAFNLLLSTTASQDATAEKVLKGSDESIIWILSKKPRVKIETHQGFTFHLDFATHGALSLANICAELKTEPKGLTLSFDPSAGMLSADYDKDAKAFRVLMGGGHTPVCTVPMPLTATTTRILLRQREQLALFAIPQSGEHATLVWLGTVGYMIEFRNVAQYELCNDLKITMGKRDITPEEFRKGVKMTALDQIEDVVVKGTNPAGEAFTHRYKFDYADVQKHIDGAYVNFLRAAGNTLLGGEDAQPKPASTPATAPASGTSAPMPDSSPAASPTASPANSPAPGTGPSPAPAPEPPRTPAPEPPPVAT